MRTLTRLCLSTAHPLLSSSNNNLSLLSSILLPITPRCRSHSLSPRCALKQTKKQNAIQKTSSLSSSSSSSSNGGGDVNLLWFLNPKSEERKDGDGEGSSTAVTGTVLAGVLLVGVVGGFGTVGYLYKDQINDYLTHFSQFIEGYGQAGYAIFVGVYAVLEIFALPAIPLTMSAGLLFGPVVGTILVSISGTLAASVSFLIARYFARDRIRKLVEGNKKFLAIDKAIGENGFKLVGNATRNMGLR